MFGIFKAFDGAHLDEALFGLVQGKPRPVSRKQAEPPCAVPGTRTSRSPEADRLADRPGGRPMGADSTRR